MKELVTAKDFNAVATQDKPVLLDFYADWCGPCKSLLPIVEELAAEYKGEVIIRKVNVDRFPSLAQKFSVRSIPALFLLKDQKILEKSQGYQSKAALQSMIKRNTGIAATA